MPYQYGKLTGKITEVLGTKSKFADAIGMTPETLTQKLHGRSDWKQTEMAKACDVLGIPMAEMPDYFFTV